MKVKYIGKIDMYATNGVVYTFGDIYEIDAEMFNNFKAKFELVVEPKKDEPKKDSKPTQRRKAKPSEE